MFVVFIMLLIIKYVLFFILLIMFIILVIFVLGFFLLIMVSGRLSFVVKLCVCVIFLRFGDIIIVFFKFIFFIKYFVKIGILIRWLSGMLKNF